MSVIIPKDYKSVLDYRQTQRAIKLTREIFESKLCQKLNLERVSAPLFVKKGEGINDDLNGTERPVEFDLPHVDGSVVQIVHSLAKWKRMSLAKYGFETGEGLYTNMNAIRRDEVTDNIHSIYVDQWDWEKVIDNSQRTLDFLKSIVQIIVDTIIDTQDEIKKSFPQLKSSLSRKVKFITSQELEELYPSLTPHQREKAITKEYKTVFLMQIGKTLKSGSVHDGRAPDYDDWDLNGDILFYNEALQNSLEISSMGIRVDKQSLLKQLEIRNCLDRTNLKFHSMLLNNELPLSVGGGIGQSRLCMLILQKAHIGEVHASIWPKQTQELCKLHNIKLL